MIYTSAAQWENAPHKRIALFGMSGLGKTYLANMLRATGEWFHYSVDYRIGTRYMGEFIVDNFKREAIKNPFLAQLLRSDSIDISSNIRFENLTPLSTYLGKPGDPAKGGLSFDEYMRRQAQHRDAEISALLESGTFIKRAGDIYDYPHFICDTGGSICEVVDPFDDNDPVLRHMSEHLLLVWIKGSAEHTEQLKQRFDKNPKPMYYPEGIMRDMWARYLRETGQAPEHVDPDAFIRWGYAQALDHRQPRYQAMADRWGVTIAAADVAKITSATQFNALISQAISQKHQD